MEGLMDDPQVIVEKLRIAQTYANSALTVRHYELGELGAELANQTKAWLKVFDDIYKGISKIS